MTDQATARELAGVREVLLRLERRLDAMDAIQLVDRQTAAKILSITPRTFDRYRNIGKVPPPRVEGRFPKWHLSDLVGVRV